MIRIGIIDDQALIRAGFRALLEAEPDFEVAGEGATGEEALSLAASLDMDVVLMDIRMPGMDGLAATRALSSLDNAPKILMLTTFELDEYVFESLRAGASGFLLKDTEPALLIEAVRIVARGDALLAPSVTKRLIAEFASKSRAVSFAEPPVEELTDRERDAVAEVANGLTNEEIARRLGIGEATVKTHLSRAMQKLGVRDRTQLVIYSYESGLVRPGWQGEEPGSR